ncbi:hypothetical protein [Mesorhizobium sp. GbtcB19]|uniref:hypothetical protein n=1 Tax=Mesorhizobium sp. GbtcB19 TaxID=2824764 RepID=UPI001C308CAA|nr:hypothetical protein [Mesorhizobium sp. GbtcB19]
MSTIRLSALRHLAEGRPFVQILRREGQLQDIAIFYVRSYALIPKYLISLYSKSFRCAVAGPFKKWQEKKVAKIFPDAYVFSPRHICKKTSAGLRRCRYLIDAEIIRDPPLSKVIRSILAIYHEGWDSYDLRGDLDSLEPEISLCGHHYDLLESIKAEAFPSLFCPDHGVTHSHLSITRCITMETRVRDEMSSDRPGDRGLVETTAVSAADTVPRAAGDRITARSSACACADGETQPPCWVCMLPRPNNKKLGKEYIRMRDFVDTWSNYTTRPPTAASIVGGDGDPPPRYSYDNEGGKPNATTTTLANDGAESSGTDQLDALVLQQKIDLAKTLRMGWPRRTLSLFRSL